MKNRLSSGLYQLRQENHARHKANADLCGKIHAKEGETPTIYLYDVIDSDPYWGFTDSQMVELLAQIDSEEFNLRINSPGGDVFVARAMFSQIAQHKAKVNVFIDGLAASAATYVALAGNHITMTEGAFWMIHNAWTLAVGDKNDFKQVASDLDKVDQSIANDYQRATGAEISQITDWMDAETWFDANDAKEVGFVDSVFVPEGKTATENSWNLGAYKNVRNTEHNQSQIITLVGERPAKPQQRCPAQRKARVNLIRKNI